MNALKPVSLLVLAFYMLVNAFIVPLIYLDFEVRRDYIADVLCINQNEAITVCGGKCYLNDRLKKVADHQEKDTETNIESFTLSLFSQEAKIIRILPTPANLESKASFVYVPLVPQNVSQGIFRPPRIS